MALLQTQPTKTNTNTSLHLNLHHSNFLPPTPSSLKPISKTRNLPISISISSSVKIIKNPSLDKHIVKQNKIRFVQKLQTLLLSKPKHYIPLHILSKCRSYLSLPKPKSLLSMIHRYPLIFQLFTIPYPPSSLSPHQDQLCVGLTSEATSLSTEELNLKSKISVSLAIKLQKLLMLSSHRRLLLSKLVHLAPDLGLPPNFRSRLCNDYPDRFKTVETSYGRALELVSWDPELALPLPNSIGPSLDLIVERPMKFKHLRLRKGVNLKRRHRDFLIKFGELEEVSPYWPVTGEFPFSSVSIEAEKRGCAVVREVLGMMVEKRTLIDHLTHFRKEFGLPNKLRGMLVRHPELFYVSLKGQRDSVFLVEGYDDKGMLLKKDEMLMAKERLMKLVWEGKKLRRERRENGDVVDDDNDNDVSYDDGADEDDGFEDLFEEDEWEDYGVEDDDIGEIVLGDGSNGEFWTVEAASIDGEGRAGLLDPW